MKYVISNHAHAEMIRRGISEKEVEQTINNPGQICDEKENRKAYQSLFKTENKDFLIRVIIDDKIDPAVVITTYRTSKINKYWRNT
jgi:hypothetical protein